MKLWLEKGWSGCKQYFSFGLRCDAILLSSTYALNKNAILTTPHVFLSMEKFKSAACSPTSSHRQIPFRQVISVPSVGTLFGAILE
jgi:hypothetical protein